ncbi:MAG: hypothetical protein KC496_00710 [Anaerolineae bacterium]|nr:hypothetical protein [Anaerolineae bacterium]
MKLNGKALHNALLSAKVRPDVEAAPWVVEQIKVLEAERAADWRRDIPAIRSAIEIMRERDGCWA